MNLHDTVPEDDLLAYLRARYDQYEWEPVPGGYDYRTRATGGLRPSAWLSLRGETILTTNMRERCARWLREGRPARPRA